LCALTKFVVVYRDGADNHGRAIVGQVAGTTITYGAESVFSAASTDYASVAALSETKFVVAYRDAGSSGYGVARVGQVTGTTISYGTAAIFDSIDTQYVSVAALSDTKFVVAYQAPDLLDTGYSIVGQVTGATDISYGGFVQFSGDVSNVSIAALSETKFVVVYLGTGLLYGRARVGQVTDTAISYGAEAVFNDAATVLYFSGGVARLSDTTFIVGYENTDDDDGRVVMGTVVGDDITFGNQVSYNAGSASYDVTVVALSEWQYVVAWDDESDFDYGKSRVGTVPSLGPATVFNQDYTYQISAAKLTGTKFVVAYSDGVNYDGAAIVGQVTGTTVSYGSSATFDTVDTEYPSVAALSANKFVVAYTDGGHGTAVVGQVSGTTITYGAEYVFNVGDTEYTSVAALSSSKFVVVYRDVNFFGYGTAKVGQISGTTISYGPPFFFDEDGAWYTAVTALSATKILVVYKDLIGWGTSKLGDVVDTVIYFDTIPTSFNFGSTDQISVAALKDTRFVVAYRDTDNFGYGTTIVGEVSGWSTSYGSETVFNAASTTLDHGVTRLSDDAFVVGYKNDADVDGRVVVGAVSGNDIAFGHGVSHNAGSESWYVAAAPLTESEFVVVWCDNSSPDGYGTSRLVMLPPSMVYLPLVLRN
jgi:hypothetical protein